jgi:hypothetical protein
MPKLLDSIDLRDVRTKNKFADWPEVRLWLVRRQTLNRPYKKPETPQLQLEDVAEELLSLYGSEIDLSEALAELDGFNPGDESDSSVGPLANPDTDDDLVARQIWPTTKVDCQGDRESSAELRETLHTLPPTLWLLLRLRTPECHARKAKTIERLMCLDPIVKASLRRAQKERRKSIAYRCRAGRSWAIRPPASRPQAIWRTRGWSVQNAPQLRDDIASVCKQIEVYVARSDL